MTDAEREQIESELDLIRTHQANLLWNDCVSDDARARRDETVGRIGPEIERLERLLNEPTPRQPHSHHLTFIGRRRYTR